MSSPLVVLIGDSIRIGYRDTVRKLLAGRAEVWDPAENGATSENVLAHLDAWAIGRGADVVHVNCGLHDIKRPPGAVQNAIPFADYEDNVRTILQRIRTETGATAVWAATTPVNQARHHAAKPFDRFEADVERCNRIAARVAGELGVAVDDLYGVVMQAGRDDLLREDGVHFTERGYVLLGRAVADCVRAQLDSRG